MEISYIGHACFKISGKNLSILCDPFDPERVGLKMPKVETDVVLVSHDHVDHNYLAKIKEDALVLDSPGEYEVKENHFQGIASFHDEKGGAERGVNTIFTFEVDDVRVCHLGDLGAELSNEQLEVIDSVDVLLIPVGGTYTIGPKEAVKIVSAIEPKIVIPMHYQAGKMKELLPVDNFLTEVGEEAEILDKLRINKKDLPEEMKVYVLKA